MLPYIADNILHLGFIRNLLALLRMHGIEVIATDGTALGIWRNSNLLPQDPDADFFTLAPLSEIANALDYGGIGYEWVWGDMFIKMRTPTGWNVDIFNQDTLLRAGAGIYPQGAVIDHKKIVEYLVHNVSIGAVKARKVAGLAIFTVADLEEYLSMVYPPNTKFDYRKEVSYLAKREYTYDDKLSLTDLPQGKCMVNGTFDPIHHGHLKLFWTAKFVFGQTLISIDSEAFSNRQGKSPKMKLGMRSAIIQSLGYDVHILNGPIKSESDVEQIGNPQYVLIGADSTSDFQKYCEDSFSHLLQNNRCFWINRTNGISSTCIRKGIDS